MLIENWPTLNSGRSKEIPFTHLESEIFVVESNRVRKARKTTLSCGVNPRHFGATGRGKVAKNGRAKYLKRWWS